MKYLRQKVGEIYEYGEWRIGDGHSPVLYGGEVLQTEVSGYSSMDPVFFTVKPLFNLSGFIPSMLSVVQVEFGGGLDYYPSLNLFSSIEPSSNVYGVTYAKYEFSRVALLNAEVVPVEICMEVPPELDEKIREIASEVVKDQNTPWENLKALELFLKKNYEYDEEYAGENLNGDPIENFLFNTRKGVCKHFNSALALLARSIGIPTRVVTGFLISPEAGFQLVMPKDAHLWVEVPFMDLGWIVFDATPERMEEMPVEIPRIPTVTNITYNDPLAVKGGNFQVIGTVETLEGSPVDGMTVEVFITVDKNETGLACGRGLVTKGVFNITCDAEPSLDVGDYNLVAHSLANMIFEESWSDPPIRLVTETEVSIRVPDRVYVGESFTIVGRLVDKSNDMPVSNEPVSLKIKNETIHCVTDDYGQVSVDCRYDYEGNESIAIFMPSSKYYLASNSTLMISVAIPQPHKTGFLALLLTFPYNMIIAMGSVFALSLFYALNKRKKIIPVFEQVKTGEEPTHDEAFPPSFKSYKEGVVKLFNYFYRSARRRHDEVYDSLTPREFQHTMRRKISSSGDPALEYLVTAFEIADYSTSQPSKKIYNKCLSAVELLKGLMDNG
jgi:transglutaminase-like putative cysteine protease